MEKEILRNGDEVLVFSSYNTYDSLVDSDYIEGVVESSINSEDMSYHGSPWYVRIYTVIGADGKTYKATKKGLIGDYLMTKDEYSKYLKDRIAVNNSKISELKNTNLKIKQKIKSL